jgi:hypothetical protein
MQTNPSSANIATAGWTFGNRFSTFAASSSQFAAVSFYEGICIQGDLTTDERQKVEGHMCHNNGLESLLPSDHPYKNAAPT